MHNLTFQMILKVILLVTTLQHQGTLGGLACSGAQDVQVIDSEASSGSNSIYLSQQRWRPSRCSARIWRTF